MATSFERRLQESAPELAALLRRAEVLAEHCSMAVGGPADYYLPLSSTEDLGSVLALCHELEQPFLVLGRGSNVVFSDAGYRGLVIQLESPRTEGACRIYSRQETAAFLDTAPASALAWSRAKAGTLRLVEAPAGLELGALSSVVAAEGLEGLAFACGIPGSVGGAIYMNAGAYEGCMQDVCLLVEATDALGHPQRTWAPDFSFAYRDSCYRHRPLYIRRAFFLLHETQYQDQLEAHIADLQERRKRSQPLELPSAGSVFKRPVGYFAGKLIVDAGLQGLQIGGAQVSEKHAGFIVNRGGATARDIVELVCHIRRVVRAFHGVELEPEIRVLEEDGSSLDWSIL